MRQALFLHSHEFQHLDHAGSKGIDVQRFLKGMFTVAAAEAEGNGRDTLAHGNVGIGAAGNARRRQAVAPADGRDAVCQGIGVQTAAGPFAEQLGFDVDRFPFSMGQEALKSLVQLVQFISIFRAQVDSEHGLCRNGIDRCAARDGADIVRRLWLGWHGQRIELADDAGDYVTILGFACKRGDGLRASRYTKPCRIFSACGGAALYRKSILDEIGVFDELFFAYYEDVDLSWRANSYGYKNVYCPTAKCRHICGATTGAVRYNPFKSIQSGRNSILLPYKNQPLLMLVLNFIPMLLGYLLKVVMFRLRGFGNDYAKGFPEAWAALPKIDKPKFRWKNLPNYIWVEGSLIVGLFRYIVYRVQRALKIT